MRPAGQAGAGHLQTGRGDDPAIWGVLAGAGVVGALAVGRLAPGAAGVLPACPFRALTGLPCPTCGVTRGVLALASGDVGGALAHSPLAVAATALALGAGLWGLVRLVAPGRLPPPRVDEWAQVWLARAVAVALLLNWVYLLATSTAG